MENEAFALFEQNQRSIFHNNFKYDFLCYFKGVKKCYYGVKGYISHLKKTEKKFSRTVIP